MNQIHFFDFFSGKGREPGVDIYTPLRGIDLWLLRVAFVYCNIEVSLEKSLTFLFNLFSHSPFLTPLNLSYPEHLVQPAKQDHPQSHAKVQQPEHTFQ